MVFAVLHARCYNLKVQYDDSLNPYDARAHNFGIVL
jgi:hypothetical protein